MFLSLQKGSTKIESRKFLPLLYQLAARMSARSLATDPFQSTLQEVYMYALRPVHFARISVILAKCAFRKRCF